MMEKILIVEDDPSLGLLLLDLLEKENFAVTWKRDALSALDILHKQSFGLCLLDVAMGGMDGFTLSRHIKDQYPSLPFIFITARTLKQDKIKGYDLGAEDYITKPFDPDELLCKIQVILRRSVPGESVMGPRRLGQFVFHMSRQEIHLGSRIVKLTEKENRILQLFCNHPNQVIRREDAVKQVYGKYDYFLGRSFDVFISRLRKILKDDPNLDIENVFKVGFMLRTHEPVGQ